MVLVVLDEAESSNSNGTSGDDITDDAIVFGDSLASVDTGEAMTAGGGEGGVGGKAAAVADAGVGAGAGAGGGLTGELVAG